MDMLRFKDIYLYEVKSYLMKKITLLSILLISFISFSQGIRLGNEYNDGVVVLKDGEVVEGKISEFLNVVLEGSEWDHPFGKFEEHFGLADNKFELLDTSFNRRVFYAKDVESVTITDENGTRTFKQYKVLLANGNIEIEDRNRKLWMQQIHEGKTLNLHAFFISTRGRKKNNIRLFYIQEHGSDTVMFAFDYEYFTVIKTNKTKLRTEKALKEAFKSCPEMLTYLETFDVGTLRVSWKELKKELKEIEKRTKNFSEEVQEDELDTHYYKRVSQPMINLMLKYDSICGGN